MADVAAYYSVNAPTGTALHQVKFSYDFDNDGGSIGNYALGELTENCTIHGIFMRGADLDSGGAATIALNIGVVPIIAATAFGDCIGNKGIANSGSGDFLFPLYTDPAEFNIDIADAALTAGTLDIYLAIGPA